MSYPLFPRNAVAARRERFEVLDQAPQRPGARPDEDRARAKVRPEGLDRAISFDDTAPAADVMNMDEQHGLRLSVGNVSGLPADFVFARQRRWNTSSYPVIAIQSLIEDLRMAGLGESAPTYNVSSSRGIDIWARGLDAPLKYPGHPRGDVNVYLIGPARGLEHLVDLTMDNDVIPRFYASVSETQPQPAPVPSGGGWSRYYETHPVELAAVVVGGLIALFAVSKILACCLELTRDCGYICGGSRRPGWPAADDALDDRSRVQIEVVEPDQQPRSFRLASNSREDGAHHAVRLHPLPHALVASVHARADDGSELPEVESYPQEEPGQQQAHFFVPGQINDDDQQRGAALPAAHARLESLAPD